MTCGIYDNVLHVSYIKYLASARMDELLSGSEAMIRKKLSPDADSCDARCNRCRLDAGFVLCGEENHEMSSPATLAWKICSLNFFISQQKGSGSMY